MESVLNVLDGPLPPSITRNLPLGSEFPHDILTQADERLEHKLTVLDGP